MNKERNSCILLALLLHNIVCYWHELLDIVFFYKGTHNLVHLSPSAVPIMRGSGRLTRTSVTIFPTFVPKRCRTTTCQKSSFIRSAGIWNLLTGRMDLANATLTSFKSLLYDSCCQNELQSRQSTIF